MSVEDGSHLPYQMPPPPENFRYLEKSQGKEEEGEGIYSQEASTTTMEWSSVSTWLHVKGRLGAASSVPQVLEMDISVLFVFFNSNLLFIYYLFLYLVLAVLGLRFCARAFSSCGEQGPLFIAVRGPLTIAASVVAEHRLQTRRLSSCGSRAQLLRGMWDLPRPGLEPVSPALAGRLSTTAPPGKPGYICFWSEIRRSPSFKRCYHVDAFILPTSVDSCNLLGPLLVTRMSPIELSGGSPP